MDQKRYSMRWLLAVALAGGLSAPVLADSEVEYNDDWTSANYMLDPYAYGYLGNGGYPSVYYDEVLYGEDDFVMVESLYAGLANSYLFTGYEPGRDFVVILDNDPSASGYGYGYFSPSIAGGSEADGIEGVGGGLGFSGMDTTMGLGDGTGNPSTGLWFTDDDGSPLGNGYASALAGTVNPDGSIEIFVSGYPDGLDSSDDTPPFDGAYEYDGENNPIGHYEEGDYMMYVIFDVADPFAAVYDEYFIPAKEVFPDTDFFEWSENPYDFETSDPFPEGTPLRASVGYAYDTITGYDVDTVLVVLDESGNELGFNDDAYSLNPIVDFSAPASGTFYVGISGYPDYDFLGEHEVTGEYELLVTLLGDINQDGVVDASDIDDLAYNFGYSDNFTDINLDGTTDLQDVDDLLAIVFGSVRGDANLDGMVDLLDLSALASSFEDSGGWADGDFNLDGVVDLLDLSILASHFGFAGVAVVPSPGSACLLAPMGLAMLRRR